MSNQVIGSTCRRLPDESRVFGAASSMEAGWGGGGRSRMGRVECVRAVGYEAL